jgi:hypothetical protein
MEGQGGLGKPRRLRLEGNQPQQGTADEANGNKEAEPCQHCQHRLRPRRPFFRKTILATNSRRENRGKRSHPRPSFDEWWKKTGTHRLSIRLTNGGIKLAESRQESGHGQHLTHGRPLHHIEGMRSKHYYASYRLGRLSMRLAIPSDQRIAAALRLPALGPGSTVLLAVLLRAFLVAASH